MFFDKQFSNGPNGARAVTSFNFRNLRFGTSNFVSVYVSIKRGFIRQ